MEHKPTQSNGISTSYFNFDSDRHRQKLFLAHIEFVVLTMQNNWNDLEHHYYDLYSVASIRILSDLFCK